MNRTASEIRRQFVDFFTRKYAHVHVPSSPVVPIDDPTLMFANAGMNQFKPLFLGTADPKSEFGRMKRAANSQKCIRAGGKHNDLDDVGKDTYHHTFFEMLGNWSFGDYFKKEAIAWAWELLTEVWGVDPTRLHATYFQGDPAEGLEPDAEARDLWLKILPPERVHPGNKKDNFWEMGDTGPCGPCSEIHIDRTPDRSGGKLVNAGDARVMEIWNLVFIQFNRGADGKLSPLPAKHVDTGMGFERITSILQSKESNYDTDVFTPIFAAIRQVTGAAAYSGKLASPSDANSPALMRDTAYRVVADHVRTLTFALTDGAVPSNEGRGYVLRRILRRGFRYGWQYLGMHEPFICRLVPAVIEAMGEAFPELRAAHGGRNAEHVAAIIRDEEAGFGRTLERGIALFDEAAQYAVSHHHGRIRGEDAFKLHDTFGFPIDLTELMAEERGLTVDIGEYERRMEEAKAKARAVAVVSRELNIPVEHLNTPTDDSFKYSATNVVARFLFPTADNEAWLQHGQIGFVFDKTCFYSEQGGQVADRGRIEFQGHTLDVQEVRRYGAHVVHFAQILGTLPRNSVPPGSTATLSIDIAHRERTAGNHTSTHLLNWALREVLGDHVQQKGSLVDPEKTRFDFSHGAALSDDELRRIEALVNKRIDEKLSVFAEEVEQKAALRINGLRAVFGEKYPERVRVVSIGAPVDRLLAEPDLPKWREYSIEFCGGTHLNTTDEANLFRLIEESAVARGVRRVVGITGAAAEAADRAAGEIAARLDAARALEGAALVDAVGAAATLLEQQAVPVLAKAKLRDRLAELQEKARAAAKQQSRADTAGIVARSAGLLEAAPRAGNAAIVCGDMGDATPDQLRSATDSLRQKAGSAAVLLASRHEGKVVLLAAMTADVMGRGVKAGDLIKEIAPLVGGRGGGKPDLAQGGGTDAAAIPAALEAARVWLQTRLAG